MTLAPEWSSATRLSNQLGKIMSQMSDDRLRIRQIVHGLILKDRQTPFVKRTVEVEIVTYTYRLKRPRWLKILSQLRHARRERLEVISLASAEDVAILPQTDEVLIRRPKARHFESFNWERGKSEDFDQIRRAINSGPTLLTTALSQRSKEYHR